MNEFINKYKGHKFGNLTVVGPEEYEMDKDMNIVYKNVYCHCDCGKQWILAGIDNLLRGTTTSCGCQGRSTYQRVINSGNTKDNLSKEERYVKLYGKWKRERREGSLCDEWHDKYIVFHEWSLNNGWAPGKRLYRTDFEKYSPENSYWDF